METAALSRENLEKRTQRSNKEGLLQERDGVRHVFPSIESGGEERVMGLEPTTASLATRYSTTELHPQAKAHFFASNVYPQAVRIQEVLWNFLHGLAG